MNSNNLFLKSALSLDNPFNSTEDVLNWIETQNKKIKIEINKISFDNLKLWSFKENFTKLSHVTGKFFSIDGVRVQTNFGEIQTWDQPIINQAEIGYLGFIVKEFNYKIFKQKN
jgi:oxidase EvaA